ncbi:hypothetical protein AL755_02260 (plasmid) [Arthrobacter sp. ERGS1:01]|nr:hypothetical protein AL755_02260 [Arthrobacter sp. ERGS1:01]
MLGVAAVIALGLSGCTSTPSPSATTSSPAAPTSASPTTSSSPSSVESSAAPTESGATASSSATPSTTGTATTAAAALCTAADLAGSLDDSGGGAAGHIYMQLIVKNSSSTTCILDGYPGVSLVNASSDTPIGAPAVRDASAPSSGPISLAPGASASAALRYTQAGNYPSCTQVQADSVMVYPPGATDRIIIAHPLTACSNSAIQLLTIGAFQP